MPLFGIALRDTEPLKRIERRGPSSVNWQGKVIHTLTCLDVSPKLGTWRLELLLIRVSPGLLFSLPPGRQICPTLIVDLAMNSRLKASKHRCTEPYEFEAEHVALHTQTPDKLAFADCGRQKSGNINYFGRAEQRGHKQLVFRQSPGMAGAGFHPLSASLYIFARQ